MRRPRVRAGRESPAESDLQAPQTSGRAGHYSSPYRKVLVGRGCQPRHRIATPMLPPSMRISALRPPSDAIVDAAIVVLKTLSDLRALPAPFAGRQVGPPRSAYCATAV